MYLNGGTYQIDSADDSIHSNANITIADGTYTLATGDDGVHADDALIVNGGTITVTESYEGLEGLTVDDQRMERLISLQVMTVSIQQARKWN